MSNIQTDDLQINNLKLMQDRDLFCFGTDSVLLANFAEPSKNSVLLDIGTGNGVIPVLLSAKTFCKHIYALEIQKVCSELAQKNIELNNLTELISVINGDIKDKAVFAPASFDYITCNPPYKPNGAGLKNPSSPVAIARHEILCTLEDIIKASSRLLKPKGKLAMVHKPERLAEIIFLMKQNMLEPKRILTVHSSVGKPPCLIIIEALKNGRPEVRFEEPLYIYDENGNYTAHISALYNKRKDN